MFNNSQTYSDIWQLCLNRMKVRERTEGEADEQFFICDANTPYTQLEQ